MAIFDFIIWNVSPEIFEIKSFALRWYGLLFALGFLISQQILYYIYQKEGKPESDVETLTIYMVVATIIGARLGHIIFYDPQIIWEKPLSIFLPFEFNPFRFTGLQGLASHGATIGILFAIWLFARKKKPGQNFFQVVDRIVILVALTGALIRFGNFFNSEIIGKPTDLPIGVVFTNGLTEDMKDQQEEGQEIIDEIVYRENDSLPRLGEGRIPLSMYVFFKPGVSQIEAERLMDASLNLAYNRQNRDFFDVAHRYEFEIAAQKDGNLAARRNLVAIARHPAQLYESISCVFLFILLFMIWRHYKNNLPQGLLFGIFLVVCFGLRFLYEFLKEPQVDFENDLPLFMGQILSVPLVIAGVVVIVVALRRKQSTETMGTESEIKPRQKA